MASPSQGLECRLEMLLNSRIIFQRNILVALFVALSIYLLQYFQWVSFNELVAIDLRMLFRPKSAISKEIVIIGINDKSLEKKGGWPWGWRTHANFIEALSHFNPRLIYYDVLFTDTTVDEKRLTYLAEKLEKTGNVILPFYYYSETPLKAFFPPDKIRQSAKGMGFSNLNPDTDGRIRKIKIFVEGETRRYFHSVLEILFRSYRDEEAVVKFLSKIPKNAKNETWVNFSASEKSINHVSYHEINDWIQAEKTQQLQELLNDKIVLVGPTFSGNVYLRPTLFSSEYPSVVLFGNALSMFMNEDFLDDAPQIYGLLIVVCLCVFLALRAEKWDVRSLLIYGFLEGLAYIAINIFVFNFFGLIIPLFMPLVALLLTHLYLIYSRSTELRFENEFFERELEMASQVQSTFLPSKRPTIEGLDIAYECRFATSVGGDLYDWLDLGEGRIGVAVGDVSGKGIPAAIYMVRAISEFRRENQGHRSPSEVFGVLNQLLAVQSYAGMFLTAIYAIVDSVNFTVSISAAGHEPMIFYSAQRRKAELISPKKGPPVGLFTDSVYETVVLDYAPGDMLLFISDGVRELRNFKKEQLGMNFLMRYVEQHARDFNASQMIYHLFEEMELYSQGEKAHDDRTLLCVKLGKYF